MADDLTGRRLGGFELQAELGSGAFATVWRARQLRLGRDVAVKVLDPQVARNPDAARRFEREGRAAASLDHPGIVPVYEAGEDDGVVFLAMRLVDGPTLAQVLHDDGELAPDRLVHIIGAVGAALDHAHERGLVHRDVKPSNILLEGERVWLGDFGIAASARELGRYTTGAIGTVAYMAPEQARAADVDHRSDLYALGCVAFECVTGRPPFQRADLLATMAAHTSDPVPPAGSPSLDAFFARALAKEPDRRFQSGAELAAALGDAMLGRGAPPARAPRRRGVARIMAAIVGLVAVVAVGLTFASDDDGVGDGDGMPTTTSIASGAAASALVAGGSVVVGVRGVPATINPHTQLTAEGFVAGNVLPPLYALDENLDWQPFLADGEPEVIATDPLTIRWRLRDDATWDDGAPITTADVIRTFDYVRDPAAGTIITELYTRVTSIVAEGDKAFVVTLSETLGDPRLLFSTVHPVIKAASLDRFLAGGGDVGEYLATGIDFSGGPFRLVAFEPDRSVRLVRNDAWWGPAAPLERVDVREMASSGDALDAVASGDADVVFVDDPQQADLRAASDLDDADVTVVGGSLQYGLRLNLTAPPLDDPAVRRAIALAIDRKAIAEALTLGFDDAPAAPGSLIFFPDQPGYEDDFSRYERDADQADLLLSQAGWRRDGDDVRTRGGERLELTILYPNTSVHVSRLTALTLLLFEQLSDIGIALDARPTDTADITRAWNDLDYELTIGIDISSPSPLAAVESYASDGLTNFTGYASSAVDDLFRRALAATDPAEQRSLLGEAGAVLAEDVPAIPIVQLPSLLVTDDRLRNVVAPAVRAGPLAFASLWGFASGE